MDMVIERGMVLGISRGIYDHYGVYVGSNEIVHFTSYDSDTSPENSIMRTPMRHFIRDGNEFFVLGFPDSYQVSKPAALRRGTLMGVGLPFAFGVADSQLSETYTLYSREECAQRAEQNIGKGKYSLLFNNCEHFAIWCKTGLDLSTQANTRLFDAGIEISRRLPANRYVAR